MNCEKENKRKFEKKGEYNRNTEIGGRERAIKISTARKREKEKKGMKKEVEIERKIKIAIESLPARQTSRKTILCQCKWSDRLIFADAQNPLLLNKGDSFL